MENMTPSEIVQELARIGKRIDVLDERETIVLDRIDALPLATELENIGAEIKQLGRRRGKLSVELRARATAHYDKTGETELCPGVTVETQVSRWVKIDQDLRPYLKDD